MSSSKIKPIDNHDREERNIPTNLISHMTHVTFYVLIQAEEVYIYFITSSDFKPQEPPK